MDAPKTDEWQYRALIEGVTDYAIYMLDPTGIVSSWNPGAWRFKGYTAAEIIGHHFRRFYTAEDRANRLPERALEIAKREGRFEAEGWRVRKDGMRFWAHVVIDPIWQPSGELVGFGKITRDLTERKEAEKKLEQARDVLAQSQKMEAIGRLTGGVAHDFNNLLMGMIGSLEIVRRRIGDDPKVMPFIENALQSAQRGAALTKRMLAFARHQDLKLERIDVPGLVRGMADLLQRTLGPAVSIETQFPLALPPVKADVNQLEMAVLNLVMNARDAMPEGGPIIVSAREIALGAQDGTLAPGRYVCLAVSDTGDGMDEATLSRAVEPFFTTKGVGKGTGLGLSVVHGVTEQLGGRLSLKSEEGVGTTAELWLPVALGDVEPAREAVQSLAPAESRLGEPTVLAVDDEAIILLNTSAMLEGLGCTVLTATSGEQALRILRQTENVDLVLTDQAMPRMTGAQLIKEIAANWPTLPVILTTGYAELPDDFSGRVARLDKPYGELELARAIESHLRR